MVIGDRLRAMREQKNFSQGDIEERTGLQRSYVSRVENGLTVPAIETLEKLARAFEVPLYQLFYDGEKPPDVIAMNGNHKTEWGSHGKDARFLHKFRGLLGKMDARERVLLLALGNRLARRRRPGR